MSNIVVIGAGVIGITNALEALRKDPLNQVTIVSQNFPTDFEFKKNYTSPMAGANWESFASLEDQFVQEIDEVGYDKFYHLINTRPEAGVTFRKNRILVSKEKFVKDGKVKHVPWFGLKEKFKNKCKFRELNSTEFDTDKFQYGFEFDGMVIQTSYYMTFLLNECWKLSGQNEGPNARFAIKRASLKKINEAFDLHSSGKRANIVINCTGLLARDLEDLDPKERTKIYPVRGVVYVAKNTTGLTKVTVVEIAKDNEALYLMPRREGELIIGGCFQKYNESKVVEEELKERILGRCKEYLPEFNWEKLEIIREQVGFRPFREGGYRIERENKVIHCYGLGGAGFQSSWGCAEYVMKLITEVQNMGKF